MHAHSKASWFLCSTLLSAALNHCQLLGYHRETTYTKKSVSESRNTRRVFWTLYIFDRSISLLFGRSPRLNDADIDTRWLEPAPNPGANPWDRSFVAFIQLAKLQGQIYGQLYSAEASKYQLAKKIQHVDHFSALLDRWKHDLNNVERSIPTSPRMLLTDNSAQIPQSTADHLEVFKLSKEHWNLVYLSTKTLLLRAPSTGSIKAEISTPCFQVARQSLESSLEFLTKYQEYGVVAENEHANGLVILMVQVNNAYAHLISL